MTAWFSMLGEPLAGADRRQAHEYLRGLDILDQLSVTTVPGWSDARRIIADPGWDRRWWDAEQLEKQRLHARAVAAHAEVPLLELLSRTLDSGEPLHRAAAAAAARYGCADPGLIAAAAGAASEALHLAELARLAAEDESHPFALKQSLFAAGRWPLGIFGGHYFVF
jgi:hypothetical protein